MRLPVIDIDTLVDHSPVLNDLSDREDLPKDELQQSLEDLQTYFDPDVLEAMLPDPELRPLLVAAIISELRFLPDEEPDYSRDDALEVQENTLETQSRILRTLRRPYKPVFIQDVIDHFKNSESEDMGTIYDALVSSEGEGGKLGINSTLRNLILAQYLNEEILDDDYKAHVCLGQYTWEEQAAKVSAGKMPTLPNGTSKKPYVKFLIAVTNENGEVVEYIDYGQNEGQERYGIQPTGEGLGAVMGRPTAQLIDPSDMKKVIHALKQVERSQHTEDDREAVRRLGQSLALKKQMVDFMETEEGASYPVVVAGVDDLTETQIDATIQWAMKEQQMSKSELRFVGDTQEVEVSHPGVKYPEFQGKKAFVVFGQPSTRTTTATDRALEALGIEGKPMNKKASSKAKGESNPSEAATLISHEVDLILWRGKEFEAETARLKEEVGEEKIPLYINLGGIDHHPTQTLGEVMLIMQDYGCLSLEELREMTNDNPPTVAFMGHTQVKRADKSLIEFILNHLPKWKVKNIAPDAKYLPPQFQGCPQYEAVVSPDLMDDETVQGLVQGCKYTYISNQEGTSGDAGKGDGLKPVDFRLSTDVVEQTGTKVLAPLPASDELEADIFYHPNSLIKQQMQNKIAIITSLAAHALSAREVRNAA